MSTIGERRPKFSGPVDDVDFALEAARRLIARAGERDYEPLLGPAHGDLQELERHINRAIAAVIELEQHLEQLLRQEEREWGTSRSVVSLPVR